MTDDYLADFQRAAKRLECRPHFGIEPNTQRALYAASLAARDGTIVRAVAGTLAEACKWAVADMEALLRVRATRPVGTIVVADDPPGTEE